MAFFFKPRTKTSPPTRTEITLPSTATMTTMDVGRTVPPDDPAVERRIIEVGTEFLDLARGGKAGVLNAAFWSDKLMDWAMQDEAFKVQLFRFVDAFPMLRTPAQIHDHLVDYLSQPGVTPPPGMDLAIKAGGVAKACVGAARSATPSRTPRTSGWAQRAPGRTR